MVFTVSGSSYSFFNDIQLIEVCFFYHSQLVCVFDIMILLLCQAYTKADYTFDVPYACSDTNPCKDQKWTDILETDMGKIKQCIFYFILVSLN